MNRFAKYAALCTLLVCLLTACGADVPPADTPPTEPSPSPAVSAPAETPSAELPTEPPSAEVPTQPPAADPVETPAPSPASLSYLSASFTTPTPLDGTKSAATELPDNIIQSCTLSGGGVYLYLRPSEQDESVSAVWARFRADGQQYDWMLAPRYVSNDYKILPVENLFGLNTFAIQWGGFCHYYRFWNKLDDCQPALLFYREGTATPQDIDRDGTRELVFSTGYENRYVVAFLSAGGDICRLTFETDRAVKNWAGFFTGEPFFQTLKHMERTPIADCVRLDPPEGYTLSVSKDALLILSDGNTVGSISQQSAPHHNPDIEQGQIQFEAGHLTRFWAVGDHYIYTDHTFIDGCAAPAVIAHSLYDPPYEDRGAGSTEWVICFAEEAGYLHYRLSLDTAHFTREEAMELARSVTFEGNAFLIPEDNYPTRVAPEEIVLHNGVRPGMTFPEVQALLGWEKNAPYGMECFTRKYENIHYGFDLESDGQYILETITIEEDSPGFHIFRDIKLGDSIESVLAKIPAENVKLNQKNQVLYGSDFSDARGYADLQYVADSYYSLTVTTTAGTVSITFSRTEQQVLWVGISNRSV